MKRSLLFCAIATFSLTAFSNEVVVKMNAVSTSMALAEKETGKEIELPEPVNKAYTLDLTPGDYIITAFGKDGATVNGSIVMNVADSLTTQQRVLVTCTAYASNKNADGTPWSIEKGDYELNVKVNTREGETIDMKPGKSVDANRYTFLAFNGNSYNAAFEPSESHRAEGFMTLYRGGTLTANVNVTGAIPEGSEFNISVPDGAELQLGMKFTHFSDFTPIEADRVEASEGGKTYYYTLANGQIYNYRTWKKDGLTHAGYFTMNADAAKCPEINFTDADYAKANPKAVNHSPKSNNGYETGDLLLNINPEHHLRLKVGDEFLAHGMRMWELTDNSTNNYFFEPDFHYTVLGTDFRPSTGVIEIDNADTNNSAWSKITAVGRGTAIVMVTYDGINLNYYNGKDKKDYLGGEYWGAIWPENTGVFVVTVGEVDSAVVPNMTVNEKYNMDALRLAGNNVDAEHDVFYYLDSEEGFYFTFKPECVASIDMATPQISETSMNFTGFSTDGIVKNEDGSYTLLLKEGKTIVRMTDASGRSAYQVLRAKPCHREITNVTRPGSSIFQPGDQVKIQYSGLFHPANKIAGIYNMSAYVTYNGIPNGSSLILGSGQYTFGSAASAQAVTVDIPADYDVVANPQLVMDEGVIQVNGYGDPIGNHRNTSPVAGRSPNFTAVPHKTYFGAIPDIRIDLNPVKYFNISLTGVPEGAQVSVIYNGTEILPDENGIYSGTFGTYSVVADAEGHKRFRRSFNVADDSDENVVFPVEMQLLGKAWDGKTKTEPAINEEGVYLISNGAELAWFADKVNSSSGNFNAELTDDIELGNFDWTPIGNSSKRYSGTFNGAGHSVSEIYVKTSTNYQGLFGYVSDARIEGVVVSGSVSGKQYVGGLAGYAAGNTSIDRCANYSVVNGTGTYVGGLVGYLNSATASLTNCYNVGAVKGTTNCGGVVGSNNAGAVMTNIFSVGIVEGTTVGACVGGTTAKNNLSNAYSIFEYQITTGQKVVTSEQMASGEICYKLGKAFTQTIGVEPYPTFGSKEVFYDEDNDTYYNELPQATQLILDTKEIALHPINKPSVVVTATYAPADATEPRVVWSSSDESVVTVEHVGTLSATLHAGQFGTATVKVQHVENPDVFDTCSIEVTNTSGLSEMLRDIDDGTAVVYDLYGRIVTPNVGSALAPGVYIVRLGSTERKIFVK